MTFDEIVSDVAERLNLTSTEAIARIGRRVNRRYRRICVRIGLVSFRRSSSSVTVTPATRDQTFTGEKVLSIKVSGATKPLDSVSYAEMQEIIPTTGNPTCWAVKRAGATSQVIQFDATMDSGLDLIVEVEDVGSTLSGSQVPAFPESWHDVLIFGTLADELRKKEKVALARDAEAEYERMLGELAYHIAVNGYQDIIQGSKDTSEFRSVTGGAGGGSGTVTHTTGALTVSQLVVGNGGADVKPLGSAGTTAQVLHGNASGLPSFGPVLESEVTGLVADLAAKADAAATTAALALKAPLASPALTGVPVAPTAAPGAASTQLATTAYADAAVVAEASVARTLTNKRITSRVTTIVSSATPAINTDNCDAVTITVLAVAITSMTSSLTGTPTNFQKLLFCIKDDGTPRAITWGASFIAKGVGLPTTTVAGKLMTVGFIYDTVAATWGCVALSQEA